MPDYSATLVDVLSGHLTDVVVEANDLKEAAEKAEVYLREDESILRVALKVDRRESWTSTQ